MIEKAHSKLIEYGTTLNREQRQELIDELLILFNVSQQRELLIAYHKYNTIIKNDELDKTIERHVDQYLSNL